MFFCDTRSGSRGGDEFFQGESSFSCLFTQTCCFSVAGFTGKGTEKAMKKEAKRGGVPKAKIVVDD